jgi:hypothetical protein
MALENVSELSQVLAERQRLGLVFARHAYGMRAWVDLFSERVPAVAEPEAKALLAQLVADNARHMLLFRERAAAYGVDPDAYDPPPEGEAIYERIPELDGLDELAGYALGSLDHFTQLLAVYRDAADGDVRRMRAALAPLTAGDGASRAAEAHELYRLRELVETPRYAHAG